MVLYGPVAGPQITILTHCVFLQPEERLKSVFTARNCYRGQDADMSSRTEIPQGTHGSKRTPQKCAMCTSLKVTEQASDTADKTPPGISTFSTRYLCASLTSALLKARNEDFTEWD